jgi:hypothetical protein
MAITFQNNRILNAREKKGFSDRMKNAQQSETTYIRSLLYTLTQLVSETVLQIDRVCLILSRSHLTSFS